VPTLVSAQLCRSIETSGEWRCTPANGQVAPGSVVFYTRLKTPADTAVEHRWYRGDRLQQKMTLRIRANQGTGYRTFSRATVGAGLGGQWKVELRAMFLRYGFRLAALGIACGLVVAIASTRLMTSLLFETSPLDPVTYLAVSIGIIVAATLASYAPAVRATAVNPVESLRAE